MTTPRDGNYVWVTWLSKLMASEVLCTWAPWFKAHYTGYAKAPGTFELAQWQVDHTQLLLELVEERRALGERIFKENQNKFQVRLSPTVKLSGTPDLIAVASDGSVTVFDAKTGKPKKSDQIQMMLYLLCLPSALPQYKRKKLNGCLVYSNGDRADVPFESLTPEFKESARFFIDLLDTDVVPDRSPSPAECHYCDISSEDCPERIESYGDGEVPDLDWGVLATTAS